MLRRGYYSVVLATLAAFDGFDFVKLKCRRKSQEIFTWFGRGGYSWLKQD